MSNREKYVPSPALKAEVQKDGDAWTLILVRDLRHPPALVWEALTDPVQLAQWAPFDADRSLASVGPVKLTTVGAPAPQIAETSVKRAEREKLLEFSWGGNLRWELEPAGGGTRLKLWHNIDRRFIAWGAAGWHVCFDVLEHLLAGDPLGRTVGPETMKQPGWQQLTVEYGKLLSGESAG